MPKLFLSTILLLVLFSFTSKPTIPDSARAAGVRAAIWPQLQKDLKSGGFREDQPLYIRLFKEPGVLEIWVKSGMQYKLFREYLICAYSGGLGPKQQERDGKCPEGYYAITPSQLQPMSSYHLAMNIGYPNAYDRQHGFTGNLIMIHGNCASKGCYAMTDEKIDEIYTMVYEAFVHGQKSVPVHIYPFKLNTQLLEAHSEWPQYAFWKNLKPGFDLFQRRHIPPEVTVVNKDYHFR